MVRPRIIALIGGLIMAGLYLAYDGLIATKDDQISLESSPSLGDGGNGRPIGQPRVGEVSSSPGVRKSIAASDDHLGSPIELPQSHPLPPVADSPHGDQPSQETEKATADESVVGRPFPLSESIQHTCSVLNEGGECSELRKFLADFGQESRDSSWASNIETRLTTYVELAQGGAFTVRNVECRSTRCILEVEARQEYLVADFDADPILARELREWIGDLGFERTAQQGELVVTAKTFFRRQ